MDPLQLISAKTLLQTGASRVKITEMNAAGNLSIVAESVRDGLWQERDTSLSQPMISPAGHDGDDLLVQAHPDADDPFSLGENIASRIVAPILREGRLCGAMFVDQAHGARDWSEADRETLRAAQREIAALCASREKAAAETPDGLRAAAVQAILDRLRPALRAHRCTFRQDVVPGYAFAVTFEARDPRVRRLHGDFTIVQSSQPVIRKMLAENRQVVHDDCLAASTEPEFIDMLRHYGGMRSQIVTPLIRDGKFCGALSVHDLHAPRRWTATEQKLAQEATGLIGALFDVALA